MTSSMAPTPSTSRLRRIKRRSPPSWRYCRPTNSPPERKVSPPRRKMGLVLSVVMRLIEHMFRSFQYILYPTARQGRALEHLLAVQCEAYNAALEERREAFRRGIRVHRFAQFPQLNDLHETRPDFMHYAGTVAPGTLTHLDRAFCAFYRT